MSLKVPFNRPSFQGPELEYIQEALRSGHISGDGEFTRRCNALLKEILGAQAVLLTTSCTHALEMAALLLDIGPDSEVILPSFTFVSTANAFALRGARLVFADISPDTLNLDPACVAALITPRTRAIVPVHYAGVGCDMDAILSIASAAGVPVVEDNAHGLLGSYKGKPLGSFGALSTLSFHETKNFTCGEGGALVINDPSLIDRAEITREKGTNRSRFFKGLVDKYTWVDLGSSYLPSELLAAVLLAQLEKRIAIADARKLLWERYEAGLCTWSAANGIRLPVVPDYCRQAYHMFYLLLPTEDARDRLIAHLRDQGVMAVFHYLPLHLSPYGSRWGFARGSLPVAEDASARLVRLPFYSSMTPEEQAHAIDATVTFRP